jgi:hypothetical protein
MLSPVEISAKNTSTSTLPVVRCETVKFEEDVCVALSQIKYPEPGGGVFVVVLALYS